MFSLFRCELKLFFMPTPTSPSLARIIFYRNSDDVIDFGDWFGIFANIAHRIAGKLSVELHVSGVLIIVNEYEVLRTRRRLILECVAQPNEQSSQNEW